MPSSPPKPPKPVDPLLDELPEFADSTDALELLVDLDPGAPEPEARFSLEDEPDLLDGADDEWALSTEEPASTNWSDGEQSLHGLSGGFDNNDLDDFATQEELPILPWEVEAQLLEQGRTLPAILDPTRETSSWERPDATGGPVELTVRIRMLEIAVRLELVEAPISRLRLGRDVLGGRILVSADG